MVTVGAERLELSRCVNPKLVIVSRLITAHGIVMIAADAPRYGAMEAVAPEGDSVSGLDEVSRIWDGIFISYSHRDKAHLERLQVHLEPYRRAGVVIWDDTRIGPGQQWREEIRSALAAAKVAILLVSADFLASKFIAENELPPLLTAAQIDGKVILPVVVGACNFVETPLGKFQATNNPSKPLSNLPRPKREEIWAKVAKAAADALVGPLYTEQVKHAEADAASNAALGQDTVLGDELDTLIALQETLKYARKDTHFPYFVRPLGPLWATSEAKLRKAQAIRRRVLRMYIDEADKELAPGDKSSDAYFGYLANMAYLRSMFDAEQWLRFEHLDMSDTFEVAAEITPELVPLLQVLPKSEAECYEQEQIAIAHVRYDMRQLGIRSVPAFSPEKDTLFS